MATTPVTPGQNVPAGCPVCRAGIERGGWTDPPLLTASGDAPSFLHRCTACGAFWEEDLRAFRLLTPEQARRRYPAAFVDWSGPVGGDPTPAILTGAAFPRYDPYGPKEWPPENALERALVDLAAGRIPAPSLLQILADGPVFVPSTAAPQPNGAGLVPIGYGTEGATRIGVFTSLERARRMAVTAPFCLRLGGDGLLARLPPGFGLEINDGYQAYAEVPPAAILGFRLGVREGRHGR